MTHLLAKVLRCENVWENPVHFGFHLRTLQCTRNGFSLQGTEKDRSWGTVEINDLNLIKKT